MTERRPYQRLEVLSRSESGLVFVRDKTGNVFRQLTEEELAGFSDPKPCEECGEQFGCEHYNCAGERLLSEPEVEAEVPEPWRAFAREAGISREDLARLAAIEQKDGEYRVAGGAKTDMRMIELALLLNETR